MLKFTELVRKSSIVLLFIAFCAPVFASTNSDTAQEAAAWQALRGGAIVLFRHALAPGGGDPPGMNLSDCKTQRNLSDEGRAQAKRMGERLRQERVPVQTVYTSQWCRAKETAALMKLHNAAKIAIKPAENPAFNSLFATPERQPAQTAQALQVLAQHKGPGALVVTTHQVAITGLTGIVPASGEGVVVKVLPGPELVVIGRINP